MNNVMRVCHFSNTMHLCYDFLCSFIVRYVSMQLVCCDAAAQELHEESIPRMNFYRSCARLLAVSGVNDFSMFDLMKPDAKRLRRNLSAIINFAKFREERLEAVNKLTVELVRGPGTCCCSLSTLFHVKYVVFQEEAQQQYDNAVTTKVQLDAQLADVRCAHV